MNGMVVRTVRAVSRETLSSFDKNRITLTQQSNPEIPIGSTYTPVTQYYQSTKKDPLPNDKNLTLKAQGENFKVYTLKS
jgi:hypothetical protein